MFRIKEIDNYNHNKKIVTTKNFRYFVETMVYIGNCRNKAVTNESNIIYEFKVL